MNNYKITLDDNAIEYKIVRKKVKNLRLKVKTDLTVEVVANKYVPLDFIHEFVEKNLEWILATKEKVEQKTVNKAQNYIDGDTVYFLGEPLTLKILPSSTNNIKVVDDIICFNIAPALFDNFEAKEKLLENWYRSQAELMFSERLEIIYPLMKEFKINYPDIKLRKMKSCWGTCHYTKNFIVLNTLLVKYPLECIDYVILHELVHFVHSNHSKDFYQVVESLMPNWKQRKDVLKKVY